MKLPMKFLLMVLALSLPDTVFANPIIRSKGLTGGALPPCPDEYNKAKWTNCNGTVTFFSGYIFAGEFKNGDLEGQVTVISPNGNKYIGGYRDGKRHGQGTYTIVNGDKYVGEFKKNRRHGQGTYFYLANNKYKGDKYVGEFKNGQPNGQGTHTKANGKIFEGIWENSKFKYARKNPAATVAKIGPAEVKTEPKTTPKPITPSSSSSTSGSGFFVSKLGHIVTNQHVVSNCSKITVGDNARRQVEAELIEADRRNDLALLKMSSIETASAETKSLLRKLSIRIVGKSIPLSSDGLLRSEDVELGETVMVAGYPYGEIFSDTIKVTGGMVSAVRGMGDDSSQFQLDAAVQSGNSGGPIYDQNGNIVGVVVAQLNRLKVAKTIGSLPENVNFGIKASTVKQFLTSAGLPTKWSQQTKPIESKDLAKIAKNQTLMVVCQHQ